MPLLINREIFDRVKAVIAQSKRINMLFWSEDQHGKPAELVDEIQEPSLLAAALLIYGAEDKYELENACLPLFSILHWPLEEQNAYNISQTDMERRQVVLRRMDEWAAEIESRPSADG